MIYLAITSFLLLAYCVYQARMFNEERREWSVERLGLLNRIQAPERVVEQMYEPKIVPAIDLDDDKSYWAEVERLNGDS